MPPHVFLRLRSVLHYPADADTVKTVMSKPQRHCFLQVST